MNKDLMFFDIDQVERIVKVPQSTLRNWEKRHQGIIPKRSNSGRRTYSLDQVLTLRQISDLIQSGAHRPKELFKLISSGSSLPEIEAKVPPCVQLQIEACYKALIELEYDTGVLRFQQLAMELSDLQFIDWVCRPIFKKLGQDWSSKKIGVYQEHFVSGVLRIKLYQILSRPTALRKNTLPIMMATLTGEKHEGGILCLSSMLHLKGWPVVYLGTELPVEELKSCVAKLQPSAICLSMVVAFDKLKLAMLAKLNAKVFIGGGAAQEVKDLPSNVYQLSGSFEHNIAVIEAVTEAKWSECERSAV